MRDIGLHNLLTRILDGLLVTIALWIHRLCDTFCGSLSWFRFGMELLVQVYASSRILPF